MTLHSTKDPLSLFQDGKLKPGIYKIKNVLTQTFVDIEEHSRRVCSRPSKDLEEGNGLWEIKPLLAGYTVKRVKPGKPDQFCTLVVDGTIHPPISVSAYPTAWRVEIVDDPKHRDFGYIRLCWETTPSGWVVSGRLKDNGRELRLWTTDNSRESDAILMWELIPIGTVGPKFPPLYEGSASGQPSTSTQCTESESEDLGTVVTEVTTVTAVTTTRRKYRVEDA